MSSGYQTILLSAGFAGAVAIGVTVAIERWGGVVGGVIGTLPTTIVPATLGFFAEARDLDGFLRAVNTAPAAMLLNALFLLLWRVVPARLGRGSLGQRLALMSAISLGAWGVAAAALVLVLRQLPRAALAMRIFGALTTGVIVVVGVAACWRVRPAPRGTRRVTVTTLILRAALAATSIGVATAMARSGIEIAAGMASCFPAIFITAMIALWLAQGEAVQAGAVGPMMLGSSAVAGYALLASETLPRLGPALGSLVAWLGAALLFSLPARAWLLRRQARQAP
ncbi:MAG: hypothetical protein KC503_01600 [Myxococcales bacterium]|nr:hypothetical protein [Myxococcales bacterium]